MKAAFLVVSACAVVTPLQLLHFGTLSEAPNVTSSPTTTTLAPTPPPTPLPSTLHPSQEPTFLPTTLVPTSRPTHQPTTRPSHFPTTSPTHEPTHSPTRLPTQIPTHFPTLAPSHRPTRQPSQTPTHLPTLAPTHIPTRSPTLTPTRTPTALPTQHPTRRPTLSPSRLPTRSPSHQPTKQPTLSPTTRAPTASPTMKPTTAPTNMPTFSPSHSPSRFPSHSPTTSPTTVSPTVSPTPDPTQSPTNPTASPSRSPTTSPTFSPTQTPTRPEFLVVAILSPPMTTPPDYVDNRLPMKVVLGFMYLKKPAAINCKTSIICSGFSDSWSWLNISVNKATCLSVPSQFPFDRHYEFGCSLHEIPGDAIYSCATKMTNLTTECEQFGGASVTVRVVSTTAMVSVVLSALSVICCLFILLFPCFASVPPSIAYYRSIADLGLGLVVFLQNAMEVSMHSFGYGACPRVLAQATQFFLFASQSWYFALGLNSFLAVRNPFRHPSSLIVYYNLAVWGAAFLSSLLIQDTEGFRSDFHVCWVSQLDAYDIWNWMFLFVWLALFLVGSLVLNVWTWVRLYSSSLQLQPSRYELLYGNTIYTLTFTLFYCGAATVWGKAYLATSDQQIFQDATLTLAVSALNSTVGLWDFVAWVIVNKSALGTCCRKMCHREREDSATEPMLPPSAPKFGDISDALRFEFILCSSEGIDIATRRAPPALSAESAYSFSLLSVSFKNENRMCVLDDTFNLSSLGGGAQVNSFRFTVYAAREFAQLRKAFGVSAEQFCESVLGDPHNMKKNFSEGSSGSFFYFTVDNKYVVKTMTKAEVAYLIALLPHLIAYMIQNPTSSLVRFYGLYSISMYGSTQRFVVMNNCLQLPVAPAPTRNRRGPSQHQSFSQTVTAALPSRSAAPLSQSLPRGLDSHNWLDADSAFDVLASEHKARRRKSFDAFETPKLTPVPATPPTDAPPTPKQEYSVKCLFDLKGSRTNRIIRGHQMFEGLKKIPMTPLQNVATVQRVWSAIAATVDLPAGLREKVLSQLCRDVEFLASRSLMDYSVLLGVHKCTKQCTHSYPVAFHEGCLAIEGKEIIHISVIDILQSWNWAKRVENWFQRAKSFGMAEPSSVDPETYAKRILLMMKRVFGEWNWGGKFGHERNDEKQEGKSDSDEDWTNSPPPEPYPSPLPRLTHPVPTTTTTVTSAAPSVSSCVSSVRPAPSVSASMTSCPTSSAKAKQPLNQSVRQGSISREWAHYHPVLSHVRSYQIPAFLEDEAADPRRPVSRRIESAKPVPSRVQAAMDSSINGSPNPSADGYLDAL